MSARESWTISCDWRGCTASVQVPTTVWDKAQRHVRDLGWFSGGMADYCPAHRQHDRAVTR